MTWFSLNLKNLFSGIIVSLVRLRFFKPGLNSVSFYSTYGIPLGDPIICASRYFRLKGSDFRVNRHRFRSDRPSAGQQTTFSAAPPAFADWLGFWRISGRPPDHQRHPHPRRRRRNDVYQLQVDKIHSLPFLWAIEWAFIFLPIIYHTLYGIWITFTGQPNVGAYGYAKNWFYVLQRISAMILVVFMVFHVLGMRGLFGHTLGI